MKKNPVDFLIGADPEFLCDLNIHDFSDSTLLYSEDYFPNRKRGEMGGDGNGILFEVRPKPSPCPVLLTENIKDIFLKKKNKLNSRLFHSTWVSGSYFKGIPIGGHIHFGVKNNLINPFDASPILDQFLGVASVLTENKNDCLYRKLKGYGKTSDIREKKHGFEYRVCASWLVSPQLSASFLSLGKTVMYEILNDENFGVEKWVSESYLNNVEKEKIYPVWPSIFKQIKTMTLYPKYKKHLDFIDFMIKKKMTWFEEIYDFKVNWGLIGNHRINQEKIDKIWG